MKVHLSGTFFGKLVLLILELACSFPGLLFWSPFHWKLKYLFDVYAGSKEEIFFDSRAWLDSDCDDDFYSVNGGKIARMVFNLYR